MWFFRQTVFVVLLCLVSFSAKAIEQFRLQLGTLQGPGWQAEGVELATDGLFSGSGQGTLRIPRLELPAPVGEITDLELTCTKLELSGNGIGCRQGRLVGKEVLRLALAGDIRFEYAFGGKLSLSIDLDRFAGGQLAASVQLSEDERSVRLRARRLELATALDLARQFAALGAYQAQGPVDVDLDFHQDGAGRERVHASLNGAGLSFANASGSQAGEEIRLRLDSDAYRLPEGWRLKAGLAVEHGLIYLDPVYLDAGRRPVQLQGAADWFPARQELRVQSLAYEQPGAVTAHARMRLRLKPDLVVSESDVTLESARFPLAYETYLQPWLFGTALGDLETGGALKGRLVMRDHAIERIELNVSSVTLNDRKDRFSLLGLDSHLDWANDDATRRSDVSWKAGSLYRLAIGEAHLPLAMDRESIALREPARIPLLDGALVIDHWQLARPGRADMQWVFDAVLTPISLESVSAALDWPAFSGKLSGVIPLVQYAEGNLEIGGVLLVRAFDGDLTVRNLHLERPFGVVPRLSADLALDNLDLEKLTRAFSFGKIEGRLSGHVRDLRMEAWEPIAFDAAFATPSEDDSRHRISQKAIDNLSNIGGGGVGNAVSQSFLQLFKEFPYDRLGISCRLEHGVCLMDGVAPAEGGYYIVKGRFLPPRIDIIGYAGRVDWESLLARLKAAISSGGATVQ